MVVKDIGRHTSERLQSLRMWVGVATIRSLNADIVPEELMAEPLNSMFALFYTLGDSFDTFFFRPRTPRRVSSEISI